MELFVLLAIVQFVFVIWIISLLVGTHNRVIRIEEKLDRLLGEEAKKSTW